MTVSLKCELGDTMRRLVVGLSHTKLDKRGDVQYNTGNHRRWITTEEESQLDGLEVES